MKTWLNKYYLNERQNLIFVIIILYNIIFCFFVYFTEISIYMQISATILTILGFVGFSEHFLKNKEHPQKNEMTKEVFIERNSWFDEIMDKEGIVILTGMSGIGKTCLLDQFMDFLEQSHISFYHENGDFWRLDWETIAKKDYIILDQFERALSFDNIGQNIQKLKELDNKRTIISVRKEFYGDICNQLGFLPSIRTVWLDYRESEIQDIKQYLKNFKANTEDSLMRNSLYGQIVEDVKQRNLSMIQVSFLGREIQDKGEEYVERRLMEHTHIKYDYLEKREKRVCDYDSVIKDYCAVQLENYEHEDAAYMFLHLLCLDHKGQFFNTPKDFQNISLLPKETVREVVEFLLEKQWIKRVKDKEHVRKIWESQYEIVHDYLQELFSKLCLDKVPSSIQGNIDFYNANCQLRRDEDENLNSWRNYTSDVCAQFLDQKNKRYINVWLFFVATYMMVITAFTLTGISSERNNTCIVFAALNFMVGVSAYYVYNYYFFFLAIFGRRYSIGIMFAAVAIVLSFIFIDYWAVSLGVEIFIVGIIVYLVGYDVRQSEKRFFKEKGTIFMFIGAIVTFLGPFYKSLTHGELMLSCLFFGLYSVYILAAVIIHINREHIMEVMGRALYGGKRRKIKRID